MRRLGIGGAGVGALLVAGVAGSVALGGQAAGSSGTTAPTPTPAPTRASDPPKREPVNCNREPGLRALTRDPWPMGRLDFRRVWQWSKGQGVTVAVVDSGVDGSHPQLRGQLAKHIDLTGTGSDDCLGHGTAVAGIIAAKDDQATHDPRLFVGVAPGARILSIKQQNEKEGNVTLLAKSIRRAADEGAKVINVSIQAHDQQELRAAVEYAQARDAVIVAAAGNVQKKDGTATPAYPASYEGVISVGSAAPNGGRAQSSNAESRVSVLAPGQNVTSTWTSGQYRADLEGTSYATPFVAGIAALVRARHQDYDHKQVKQAIEMTADGGTAQGTGRGMINPLRAVTVILPDEPYPAGKQAPIEITKRAEPDRQAAAIAGGITGGAIAAALLVAYSGVMIRLHRQRRARREAAEASRSG